MKATDHVQPHRARARCLAALVCLAGLGLSAHAASTVTLSEQLTGWSPNPGGGWVRNAYNPRTIDAANATRSWAAAGAGASAKIIATDVSSIAGRAGSLTVSSAMGVSLGEAAGAVGRCLLGGGVVCGAASAAAAAYAAYRVYATPEGLAADPGIAPTPGSSSLQPAGWDDGRAVARYTTPDEFAAAYFQYVNSTDVAGFPRTWSSGGRSGTHTYEVTAPCYFNGSSSYRVCPYRRVTTQTAGTTPFQAVTYASYNGTASAACFANQTPGLLGQGNNPVCQTPVPSQCPASIDPTNSAYNVPAGSPVGADGKCPTARYNHAPITASDAAAKVVANPPANGNGWVQPTKDAIDTGGESAPAGITTTGPSSQTGTPTTTTTTGGSPSQTITETKTPTYTYNYAGDTITYNTSITNVTNNITTGVTTTTTTSGNTAAPQDPNDPCTANPDRLGCMKLGSTPTDTVPTKAPNISYTAESVGLPSGCPADQVISGKAYSFGPICAAATDARPWVIVGAIFSSLMLMLAGVRQI